MQYRTTTPNSSQQHTPMRTSTRGFTLVELMIVVSVLAILGALAAPSFKPLIEKWRVRQAVEEMTSTLYFARTEAIKRGGRVVIRKLNNSATCTFAPTNADWGCGWIVFLDTDGNGFLNGSEITLQTSPQPSMTNIVLPGNGGFINVDRWGAFNGLSTLAIRFVPEGKTTSDPSSAGICVSSGGRVRTVTGTAIC